MTPRSSRVLIVFALAVAAAVLVGSTPAALAHNVLRSSDPENGSTVPAPAQVTLTFDQSVQTLGTAVRVDGPKGSLELDPVSVDGQTVVQPLPARLAAGDYTVLWRATSSDGHPVDGTLTFTATAATRASSSTSDPVAPTAPAPASTSGSAGASSGPGTTSPPNPADPANAAGKDTPAAADVGDGRRSWPLWVGVGAVVALLAAAGLWLLRRDRPATS